MSDQWGAAQPPFDPEQQSQQDQGQAYHGGSSQQQYGQGAPASGLVPDQSGGQQYPYGQGAPQYGQHGGPGQSQPQPGYGAPGQSQAQPQFGGSGEFQAQGQYAAPGQSQASYGVSGSGVGPVAGQIPQQGFAVDPFGGAYAGAPYGGAAPKQTNGLALAGAILSVLPLLGLIFSIIGLSRAKVLGGAGRTAATVGIVLSLLFAAGWGTAVYFAATKLVNSTAADPACISAESAATSMESKLDADESVLSDAESSDSSSKVQAALDTMVSDMESIKGELDGDVAKATHATVKAKLQAFDTDLGKMITDLKSVENGDESAADDLDTVASRLSTDGDAVDSLCENLTNG